MKDKEVTYPQYRKYLNGKSYFKIVSPEEFEEIQLSVDKWIIHYIVAKVLPDRNYIYDMTFDYHQHWVVIDEGEYQKKKMLVQ